MSSGASALSQTLNGSIAGTITDESGALVPGAKVVVQTSDGKEKSATWSTDGKYALSGLAPGAYSVEATVVGSRQRKPAREAHNSRLHGIGARRKAT